MRKIKKTRPKKRIDGLRSRGRSRVTRVLSQRGTSNTKSDAKRSALLPGRRISKTGRKYTERRKNRSDGRRSRT